MTNRNSGQSNDLEQTILDALQNYLMDEDLLKIFCEEYTSHTNELRKNRQN